SGRRGGGAAGSRRPVRHPARRSAHAQAGRTCRGPPAARRRPLRGPADHRPDRRRHARRPRGADGGRGRLLPDQAPRHTRADLSGRAAPRLVIERGPEAEQRTDADTFRALHEIAVAVGGLLEPGPLAELVVDRARDLMGVGGAVLRWWEPEAGVMRMLANQQPHEVPLDIPPDQGSMGRVFTTRRPVRVNDYPNWPHAAPWAVRDGARAALFV